jgi:hypothetical protein
MTANRTFRESALVEISRWFMFRSMRSAAPASARAAYDLRSEFYAVMMRLHRQRDIETISRLAKLQADNPKLKSVLCKL